MVLEVSSEGLSFAGSGTSSFDWFSSSAAPFKSALSMAKISFGVISFAVSADAADACVCSEFVIAGTNTFCEDMAVFKRPLTLPSDGSSASEAPPT